MQKQLDFARGDNLAACGKYLDASYLPKPGDVRVLSENIAKLTELKDDVNKLKDELRVFDESLFDKTGRKLCPGRSVHHDFDVATIEKLNTMSRELSSFITSLSERDQEVKNTFKGLVLKAGTSKSRKRKQNDRKARRRKEIRLENGRKAVFQKIAPDVGTEEVMGLTKKVDKGDLIIEELEGLAKREVKILSDILESEDHFITDEARKFILDYLPVKEDVESDQSSDSGDDRDSSGRAIPIQL